MIISIVMITLAIIFLIAAIIAITDDNVAGAISEGSIRMFVVCGSLLLACGLLTFFHAKANATCDDCTQVKTGRIVRTVVM